MMTEKTVNSRAYHAEERLAKAEGLPEEEVKQRAREAARKAREEPG
jgi:hypothetical protein